MIPNKCLIYQFIINVAKLGTVAEPLIKSILLGAIFFFPITFHDPIASSTGASVGRNSSHLLLITTSHFVCLPQ